MIIYHGSYMKIEKPNINHSRKNVDFGQGFYTTPIKEQAINWAIRYKKQGKQSIVSSYEFDENKCKHCYNILEFHAYTSEWLEYIVSCRRGDKDNKKKSGTLLSGNLPSKSDEITKLDDDVIIGGVANDKVFNTIELYFDGLIEQAEAIKRLQYERPNLQICFRNQTAIEQCVTFIGSEEI
ncbi:MAG: DUF3990 domain-containing protein [Eubacteriales bacterium]